MIYDGVFLADGPSDLPLARHLEQLCELHGAAVSITRIDPELLAGRGRTVEGRLRFLKDQHLSFSIIFVHRDSESTDPEPRYREIARSVNATDTLEPVVPVVPVRMTEAWLLLDEAAIRQVAGRPHGTASLELPHPNELERIADPKGRLADALLAASEARGRRRQRFQRDFPRHRALLLERLDLGGPVTHLAAWRRLQEDIDTAITALQAR